MMQPNIDAQVVETLTKISSTIDGGGRDALPLVTEFNRIADTDLTFEDFQGICGSEDHETFVRRLLITNSTMADPTLDRDKLVEIFEKVLANVCDEDFLAYAFASIEKTFGVSDVSELVFWPGSFFGDGNDQRELKPTEMADAILDRRENQNKLR
jgi:hypothetical protein